MPGIFLGPRPSARVLPLLVSSQSLTASASSTFSVVTRSLAPQRSVGPAIDPAEYPLAGEHGSAAAPRPLGGPLVVRATVIWFAILVLASLNGAVRDLVMAPRIGDTIGRAISTVVLCALIILVTWLSIRWIGPGDARQALEIGAFWLVLTLLFEFGAGHYLSHKPWAEVLADYNVLRGRIWVLVPFVTFCAPLWAGHARDLWRMPGP
jgi:hypothetical protein